MSTTLTNSTAVSDSEQVLIGLAKRIVELKLEVPCILFLEVNVPLCGLTHAFWQLGMPLFMGLLGAKRFREVSDLLENPNTLQHLAALIEEESKSRKVD